WFGQAEQNELPRVELEPLLGEGLIYRTAKWHELRLNSRQLRNRPHREKHLFNHAPGNRGLVESRGSIESADQSFLLFQHIKRVARRRTAFIGDTAGQRMRLENPLNQFQRTAIVPVKFVTPMERFFIEKRLNLAHRRLAEVNNVHEMREILGP